MPLSNHTAGSTITVLNFNSSKFDYLLHSFQKTVFYEWVTANLTYPFNTTINYHTSADLSLMPRSNLFRLIISSDSNIYFTGMKVHILLFIENVGQAPVLWHQYSFKDGIGLSKVFSHNFNINSSTYGA